jgi:hypothetical protein
MNKLKPGSIPKISTTGGQFKMMENINKFQDAIKRYGVPDIDVFQTVDLYERRNIPQVTQCIMALGRTVRLELFRTFPTFSKLFRTFPTFSKLFRTFPIFSNLFIIKVKLIKNYLIVTVVLFAPRMARTFPRA